MVAIVSGNQLGLSLGSLATAGAAGARGAFGNAANGRSGESVYVNAATGNLVLQARDDTLAARGLDAIALRTYNSLGLRNDDNGDNWSNGFYATPLRLVGTRNAAGSSVVRIERDGAEATYTWDGTRYVSFAGAGARDTVTWDAATSQWWWTDGDTGVQDRYEGAGANTGRLVQSRDAEGQVLGYFYNAAGLVERVQGANGEQTFYDYTGTQLAQIRTVTDPAGVPTTLTRVRYAYDAQGRLAGVTVDLTPGDNSVLDGKVYGTTYTYDGTSTRLRSVTQTDGTALVFTWKQVGADWRVETVTDALGGETRFTYDTTMRRTTVRDALLQTTQFDYDAQGQLLKVTAPPVVGVSATLQFAWSANGDLLQTIDGANRTTTHTYDASGNLTLTRDHAGNTVTRTWDARNQLASETVWLVPDPDGAGALQASVPRTTRYVYDAAGRNRLRFLIGAEGGVTEYRYDAWGQRIAEIVYPTGIYAIASLAPADVPTEAQLNAWVDTQDRTRTQRTDLAWDARGQLKTRTAWATVNAAGNGVADAGRSVTQYVYSAAGELLSTLSPASGSTTCTYDGLGRLLTTQDALGQWTLQQYDDAAAKTTLTLAGGLITTQTWDRAGRLVAVQAGSAASANLGVTRHWYDARGALRMSEGPTGARAWKLYDESGRLVADIDATGALTEYGYDASDRLTRSLTYATAVSTAALVDASGNPVNVTLAAIRPATSAKDVASWRAYDSAGRLAKAVDAAGAVTEFTYDGASRLIATVARASTLGAAALAALGAQPALAAIAPAADAVNDRATRRFFDGDGRLLATLDAEGYLAENRYDAAGRLVATLRYATVTAAAQRANGTLAALRPADHADDIRSTFVYNNKGQVAGLVDAEGYLTEKVYDTSGNLVRTVRYAKKVTATIGATSTVADLRPAADPEDQASDWTYDKLDRVTRFTNAERSVSLYTYDAGGHLVKTVQASGTADTRTLQARYDVQGRLVGELSGEGSSRLTGSQTQAEIDAIWADWGVTHTYDARGLRTGTTDANGHRTVFFHDTAGRLTHTVNALGEVTENRYDTFGRLESTTRYATRIAPTGLAGGKVTSALTSAIAAVRDTARDSTTRWTWLTSGAVDTVTDAEGAVTTRRWNAFGELREELTTILTGRIRTDRYTRDRRGLVTLTERDALGLDVETRTGYDAFGRVNAQRDAKGIWSTQRHDRLGRVVETVARDGTSRGTQYDAFDRVLVQRDAFRQETRYAWTTSTRSVTMTTPEGVSVTTVRNRHGEVTSVKDGRGNTTKSTYDLDGRLVKTESPLGANGTVKQAYDHAGNLLETVDARGTRTTYDWDDANRLLTRTVDPTGLALTTRYAHDALGRTWKVTDARNVDTVTTFDRNGRALTQTVDPTGLALETRWTWDGEGRQLTVTDAAGTQTAYAWDNLGRRLSETVDPTGLALKTAWAWDANGNATGQVDANNQTTRYAYDAMDRLVWRVDPAGGAVHTAYDAEGRLVRTTRYAQAIANVATLPLAATAAEIDARVVRSPGRDAVDARRHDRDGRLRYTVDGNGAVVEFRHDGNGNVTERIAYANAVSAATVTAWDGSADPVVTADAARDQRTRTVYDVANRATHVADALGAVTKYAYDNNGNVTRVDRYAAAIGAAAAPDSVVANGADRAEVYAYDAANRQTVRVDAIGACTRTEYDAAGNAWRTTQFATTGSAGAMPSTLPVNAALDRVTTRVFDAAGRLTHVADPLRQVTSYTYDDNGRVLTTRRHATAIAEGVSPATVPLAAADRVESRGYDVAGRLVLQVDALGGRKRWTYDGLGHQKTFTNEKDAVWTYTYDAAGRLETETSPEVTLAGTAAVSGGAGVSFLGSEVRAIVTRLAYDALGQLVSRTEAEGRPEARTTTYRYDAAGRQVAVTYPKVTVYNEPVTALAGNGATGLAARAEGAAAALTSRTLYDTLGNAVASVDVAGAVRFKAYDAAGRVVKEVDPLGYVTSYDRNAFGDVLALTRHQARTTLVGSVPASAADAPNAAQIAAALKTADQIAPPPGKPWLVAKNRVVTTTYDKLGRAATVSEPAAYVYDSTGQTATTSGQSATAAKTTLSQWNAFGELVRTREQRTDAVSVDTYHYWDKAGREVGTVDALGYLTQREYDAVGNLVKQVEWATAFAPGKWGLVSYTGLPTASADDRITTWTWDRLNRKTAQTRVQIRVGTRDGNEARADVTTTWGYDAVGNLTRTTDALGGNTYSVFDALGRVTAVIAPARSSTTDGRTLRPLTTFLRDAHGNVVRQREHANGAAAAVEFTGNATAAQPGYEAGAASADDRDTWTAWDASASHAVQSTDATGTSRYFSYDASGRLAKTWQAVTNAITGQVTTLWEAYAYDAAGQRTIVYTPAPNDGTGLTTRQDSYNAFGEVVSRQVNGDTGEFSEYDDGGRLWRTNAGDGVVKVYLYDRLGRRTAEIRSAGSALDRDLRLYASADAVAGLGDVRRTDTVYDALGRVTATLQPKRAFAQNGVQLVESTTTVTRLSSALLNETPQSFRQWMGENRLALAWQPLGGLGAGDVKVTVSYVSQSGVFHYYRETGDGAAEAYDLPYTGSPQTRSQVYNAADANSGVTMTWAEPNATDTPVGGVDRITGLQVWKKDLQGNWVEVVNWTPQTAAVRRYSLQVALPADRADTVRVETRLQGSTGGWSALAANATFGDVLRYDPRALGYGTFEYRVLTTTGGVTRTSATGSLTLTEAAQTIAVPIAYASSTSGVLAWAQQPAAVQQTFRYRALPSGSAWSTLSVAARGTGLQGVDTTSLAAGTYQFELRWDQTGQPPKHAIGTFTVVAATSDTVVPPVGKPQVTGIVVGQRTVAGQTITGLSWDVRADTPSFRYKPSGGSSWTNLPTSVIGSVGHVSLASLAAGSYDWEINYSAGATVTGLGTGTLVVKAPGQPGSVVVRVDVVPAVWGDTTVTPPDPAGAITGYSRATYGTPRVGPTDGNDDLTAPGGSTLDGGAGDDIVCVSGAGGGTILGGAGDDWLIGMSDGKVFDGGSGHDFLQAGLGSSAGNNTYLFGRGDGQDTVLRTSDNSPGRVNTLRLKAGIAPADVTLRRGNSAALGVNSTLIVSIRGTTDRITVIGYVPELDRANVYNNIQQIVFDDGTTWDFASLAARLESPSAPNQHLAAGSGNDTMTGSAGDDILWGMGSDDTLDGGAGNDLMRGGAGNTTYWFGRGGGQDRIYSGEPLAGTTSVLRLQAGVVPGDIRLRQTMDGSNNGFSSLEVAIAGTEDVICIDDFFNAYNDYTYSPVQQIRFEDGTVWDRAAILSRLFSGSTNPDRLFATTGATVYGGAGGDLLMGSESADVLNGGDDDDTLRGASGDDVLDGGRGVDLLDGGAGSNTYRFGRGDGQDTVVTSSGAVLNTLQLKAGVAVGDIVLRHVDNGNPLGTASALEVSIRGTTDRVLIQGYNVYAAGGPAYSNTIHRIRFDDGTTWDLAAIEARIDSSQRPVYGAPVVTGSDFFRNQTLARGYAWKDNAIVAVPYTVWGQITPEQRTTVYGEYTVTTPPYTPGYTKPGTPKTWSATLTTGTNSSLISGPVGSAAAVGLTAGLNGDSVDQRPVVNQIVDRWGNVVQTSDPRNASWKTVYAYDANNQVVRVTQPDPAGAISAASPVTQTFYDALGREVATRDARGNVNGKTWDAGGQVTAELHADGGTVTYAWDAFGQKARTVDAVGNAANGPDAAAVKASHTTNYAYDRASRLVTTTRGQVGTWQIDAVTRTLQNLGVQAMVERDEYDAAGRKTREIDAGGRTVEYRYDRNGNIVQTRKAGTSSTFATFDARGRKATATDENGAIEKTTYDAYGRLTGRDDIGTARYAFGYDNAGQLVTQTSSRGQNLAYVYDAAGQVTQVTQVIDASVAKVTRYAYDLAGRRVLERTVQAGVTYQDNHLGYDTLGRLRLVDDSRVHMVIDYDAAGNRSRIETKVNIGSVAVQAADDIRSDVRYFQYDAMNRQTVVDAIDAAGNISWSESTANGRTVTTARGHKLTYDLNGNRTSDTFYGNKVSAVTSNRILRYLPTGEAVYEDTDAPVKVDYRLEKNKLVTERYGYDALDRLWTVDRDGVQTDVRYYDTHGSVVQTGVPLSVPLKYRELLNKDAKLSDVTGSEQRRNIYDALGRLTFQVVHRKENDRVYEIYYDNYDQAGNVLSYVLVNRDGKSSASRYTSTLDKRDGYVETSTTATGLATWRGETMSQVLQGGRTDKAYDGNGCLVALNDTKKDGNDRTFVNDAAGKALYAAQAPQRTGDITHAQRQLVVNGEVMGRYGDAVDEARPRDNEGSDTGAQLFRPLADFNFGYQPINGNYPTASAGTYTIRTGDTLQSIAQGAYGDSRLWYRIADANGLASNGDLRVGQTLTIPNSVGTVHNSADTAKPYDPSKITGDTTPYMPAPANGNGCGGIGMILVIVVAIVVTVFTYGALAEVTGPVIAGAVSGAAGAAAGQLVGNVTGVYDGFDWKAVAMGAVGGAITGGLSGVNLLGEGAGITANAVARAAVGNALSQGVGVVTGLQDKFDWRGVAASAVGSVVGLGVGKAVSGAVGSSPLGQFVTRFISGLAAGATASLVRGGRIYAQQVAMDAFGNALGESIVASSQSGVDWSKAPDQSDAETARLNRFQAAARAADGEEGIAFNNGVPPRPGMKFTDGGWQYLDGNAPGGYGDGAVLAANHAVTKQVGPGQFKHVMSDGRTVYDSSPYAPPTEEGKGKRDQLQERYETERMAENPAIRAATYSRFQSFAEDVAARKAALPSVEVLGMTGLEKTHLLLDGVNLAFDGPLAVIGAGAGLVDAGLDLYEGKRLDAAMSLAGTIPLIGAELSGARVGSRATRIGGFEATEAVEIGGRKAASELGASYQAAISRMYGQPAKDVPYLAIVDGEPKWLRADTVARIGGKDTAIEAKYVDDWASSPRNPVNDRPFPPSAPMDRTERAAMLEQARNYSTNFDGGAVYHTNSIELATYWSKVFSEAGLQNIRWLITPTVRR